MGSTKKKGWTVRPVGEEQQGKAAVQDAVVKKRKIEVDEEKSGRKSNASKAVKLSSTSEIDEIFGDKKRKTVVAEPEDSRVGAGAAHEEMKKKVKGAYSTMQGKRSLDKSKSASGGKPRSKTIDGFTIYSEDEIGWNKKNAGSMDGFGVDLHAIPEPVLSSIDNDENSRIAAMVNETAAGWQRQSQEAYSGGRGFGRLAYVREISRGVNSVLRGLVFCRDMRIVLAAAERYTLLKVVKALGRRYDTQLKKLACVICAVVLHDAYFGTRTFPFST